MLKALVFSLIPSCVLVLGNSVGSPVYPGTTAPACNATANYGCSKWTILADKTEDRVHGCTEVDPITKKFIPLMYWAKKTTRTDIFTLRSGNDKLTNSTDPKSYSPGKIMQIYLNVNDYNYKFRGILLYAEDASQRKVGEWLISPSNEDYKLPWNNLTPVSTCANSVTHSNSETKPLFSVFNFRAPPAGTGKITFRCLIKVGTANAGSFHFPNLMGDLKLEEDLGINTSPAILTTPVGSSCSEYCAAQGMGNCDGSTLKRLAANFKTVLSQQVCNLPLLESCPNPGLTSDANDWCYSACGSTVSTTDYCEIKSTSASDGNRFCVCTYQPTTNPAPTEPDATTAAPAGPPQRLFTSSDGKLTASWYMDESQTIATFTVTAVTKGWVAIGFNLNSRMDGADVVIGGVDDVTGDAYISDGSNVGYEFVEQQASDNVKFVSATQDAKYTILKFTKKINPGGSNLSLVNATSIVWAYSLTTDIFSYHGSTRGATGSMDFMAAPEAVVDNNGFGSINIGGTEYPLAAVVVVGFVALVVVGGAIFTIFKRVRGGGKGDQSMNFSMNPMSKV